MTDDSLWRPVVRESGIRFHDAMMMKRRFQVKMGAQQYHQTASHPRDVQTRSDRELVFLLQKDSSQRTVHVSHFQLDAFTHLFFTVDPIRCPHDVTNVVFSL